MAFPDTLLSNQWGTDADAPTFIPPSLMNTRIDTNLNALATAITNQTRFTNSSDDGKSMQLGSQTVAVTTAQATVSGIAVVFPTAYTTLPILQLSLFSGSLANLLGCKATALSATGFTATVFTTNAVNFAASVSIFLHWTAVGS